MLNQPLGACIFSSISAVLRQSLGVWDYISINDYINIATGRMYQDSHWAYGFYNFRDRNATGRIQ